MYKRPFIIFGLGRGRSQNNRYIQQHVKESPCCSPQQINICIPPSRSCITCGYDEKSHHPSSEENIKRICSLSTALVLYVFHIHPRGSDRNGRQQRRYTADTRFPHDVCI
jgi:hypothetical protein